MGTIYYIRNLDKKLYADLDKFYCSQQFFVDKPQDMYAAIEKEMENYLRGGFVARALRVLTCVNSWSGDRIDVINEHHWHPCDNEDWQEVLHWPETRNCEAVENIDLTDPTAPDRVYVKTKYGGVILDVREDGVNAFSLQHPGGREDYLVLPKSQPDDLGDKQ